MNNHLKPDRDTNLNDPRSEVVSLDCKLRVVWSSMAQKIEFSQNSIGLKEHSLSIWEQTVHKVDPLLVAWNKQCLG